MKFHCNACRRDFTTLAERDDGRKFALHHMILDKMKCPHCGASNWNRTLRPLKKTRNRYQPKRRSVSDLDYTPPNIIVHPDCQKRLVGSVYSPEGYRVICDGCKSKFNCWTGNVDDGDYNSPLEKSREQQVAEAKVIVEKKRQEDAVKALQELRERLGKVGFGYQFKKETWYAKFGGTVWKLTPQDIEAILRATWETAQTTVINRTFQKRGVNPSLAKVLLGAELVFHKRT